MRDPFYDTVRAATGDSLAEPRLPDDAICLHCGYALRGLSGTRCPECGQSFDAEQYRLGFVIRWPRIMVWILAGMLAPGLFVIPTVVTMLCQRGTIFFSVGIPLFDWSVRGSFGSFIFSASLSWIAIIGLVRRRDWGRKLSVIILIGSSAILLVCFVIGWIGSFMSAVPHSFTGWSSVAMANEIMIAVFMPQVAIASYLMIGLRPHSCSTSQPPETHLVFIDHNHPREDWLLLVLLMTGMLLIGRMTGLGLLLLGWLQGMSTAGRVQYLAFMVPSSVAGLIAVAAGAFIIPKLWHNPAHIRSRVGILLSLIALSDILVGQPYFSSILTATTASHLMSAGYTATQFSVAFLCSGLLLGLFVGLRRPQIEETSAFIRSLAQTDSDPRPVRK